MSTAPVMKKPPPPPSSKNGTPTAIASGKYSVSRGVARVAERIGIFGPGGCGKTSLVASLEKIGKRPLFVDLDEGSNQLDVARVNVETWNDIRAVLKDDSLWADFDTVVIDSATKAEELAGAWVLQNVKAEKNREVTRLAEYGYGKELEHIYETFLCLMADLDRHYRAGRNVVLVMHECTASVPNPSGDDFIRYEPRLQSPKSGKNSIRHRVKEWVDHLFFVGYDVHVNDESKARGSGTRTIYPQERPTHWAKSRSLSKEIVYTKDSIELWNQLFNKETF